MAVQIRQLDPADSSQAAHVRFTIGGLAMVMLPKLAPLPDPETLLIIGVISGIVAVGTFILWDQARQIGPQLETPEPLAIIFRRINLAVTGEAPPA